MSQSGGSSGHADQRVEDSDDVLPPADIVTPKDNANEVTPPAGGEKEAAAAADALISNPIDRVDGIQSGEEAVNGGNKTTEEVPKVDGAQQSNHDNDQETEQTVAAKLEHKLKIDRREWRRLIDECKKCMKTPDGEEPAGTIYYQVDEIYKSLIENTTQFVNMEAALPEEKERRNEDLEKFPVEFKKFDDEYKLYRTKVAEAQELNRDLLADLEITRKKNTKSKRSSRRSGQSERSSVVLRKKLELQKLMDEALAQRIQEEAEELERQRQLELEELQRKQKQQKEDFERKRKAILLQHERERLIKEKELEIHEMESSRGSGSQRAATSYPPTETVHELQKKKDSQNKNDGTINKTKQDLQNKEDRNKERSSVIPQDVLDIQRQSSSALNPKAPLWNGERGKTDTSHGVSSPPSWLQGNSTPSHKHVEFERYSDQEQMAINTQLNSSHLNQAAGNGFITSPSSGQCSSTTVTPTGAYLMGKMLSEVGPEHKFRGEKLKYLSFRNNMRRLAHEYAGHAGMLLQVLFARCEDPALATIKFCSEIYPVETAFATAMDRLELFYGNKVDIMDAHMKHICRNEKVLYSVQGFQKFLTELQDFSIVLDNSSNNLVASMNTIRKITCRLPYQSREIMTRDLQRCNRSLPTFPQLMKFVESELRHVANPLIKKGVEDTKQSHSSGNSWKSKHSEKSKSNKSLLVNAAIQNHDGGKPPDKGCDLCNDKKSHEVYSCPKFKSSSVEWRRKVAKDKMLCYACLRTGHRRGSKECRIKGVCSKCGSPDHNTLLCTKGSTTVQNQDNQKQVDVNAICCSSTNDEKETRTYLPVIPILVKLPDQPEYVKANALLDSACNGTMCLNTLAKKLGCSQSKKYKLWINHACGSKLTEAVKIDSLVAKAVDADESGATLMINDIDSVAELPKHGNPVSGTLTPVESFPHLEGLNLPVIDSSGVDILIGTNNEHLIVAIDRRAPAHGKKGPAAWRTPLGWTLVGSERTNDGLPRELSCAFMMRRSDESGLMEDGYSKMNHAEAICSGNPDTCKLLHQEVEKAMYGDFEPEPDEEDEAPSKNDIEATKMMEEGTTFEDGHWVVPLPLRDKNMKLPDNRSYAVKRLMSLVNTLLRKADLLEFYSSKMDELKENYLEVVNDEKATGQLIGRIWYLVHFCTQQTKRRIVYDAPAEYKGYSLNGILFQGSDNMHQLTDVLMRFRRDPIAFVCDIKEMFLQVGIPEQQRDLLRILWFKDNDLNGPIVTYRFKYLPYGLICSMSMAAHALSVIADKNQTQASPETVDMLRRNFYVDDGLGCAPNLETALKMATEIIALLGSGGFKLRKFASNSKDLMKALGVDQLAPEVKDLDLSKEDIPEHKVLGVFWDPNSDRFVVKVQMKPRPLTKRGCWSMISNALFDPIGICQPYLLKGRQILQEVCEVVQLWDDPLPDTLCNRWKRWYSSLHHLEDLSIRRCYTSRGRADRYQIHTFVDASTSGLGAVSYLRASFDDGLIEISFLQGKSRIVSKGNTTSVPKLELRAAILGSKLHRKVKRSIGLPIEKSMLWTDSTSVKNWIQNRSSRFSKYIARNVAAIELRIGDDEVRHVPTACNPADIASRGEAPAKASMDTIWLNGPDFLYEIEEDWPCLETKNAAVNPDEENSTLQDVSSFVALVSLESKDLLSSNVIHRDEFDFDPMYCCYIHKTESEEDVSKYCNKFAIAPHEVFKVVPAAVCEIVSQHSVWHELLIRLALRKRWIISKILSFPLLRNRLTVTQKAYKDQESLLGRVSALEIEQATVDAVRVAQQEFFGIDFLQAVQTMGFGKSLKQAKSEVSIKAKPIVGLLPYVDVDGLLKVGGRLHRSNLPQETIHPPILPKRHHVTRLIVEHTHQLAQHAGHQWVLSHIMQRYWIVHGTCTVKHYLQHCLFCRERRAKVGDQIMAPLPRCRVTQPHYPFEHTGVDYWGPMSVAVKRSTSKRWGAIFTCMATRACHLELVQDLTTSSFIQAFIRFINRRGSCTRHIYSDNGTNFQGAQDELKKLSKKLDLEEGELEIPFGMMDPELSYALEHLDTERISSMMARRRIDVSWKFNTPRSSHQGGSWERLIRTLRSVMCSIVQKGMHGVPALQKRTPSDFEMLTILTEVECIINNRPLTRVTDDPEDLRTLSPQCILSGVLHSGSPAGKLNNASQYKLNWKFTQIVAQQFWFLWRRMYLPWLQVRHKWKKKSPNLKIGDLVLVLDVDNDSREWYPKAVIKEVFQDEFGDIRNVKCKLSDGREFKRSVQKLVPLELNVSDSDATEQDHSE